MCFHNLIKKIIEKMDHYCDSILIIIVIIDISFAVCMISIENSIKDFVQISPPTFLKL